MFITFLSPFSWLRPVLPIPRYSRKRACICQLLSARRGTLQTEINGVFQPLGHSCNSWESSSRIGSNFPFQHKLNCVIRQDNLKFRINHILVTLVVLGRECIFFFFLFVRGRHRKDPPPSAE